MKPQQQQRTVSLSHPTMESLALPKELYWDGKSEPISPPSNGLFEIAPESDETENWLYDDNFANEILLNLELKPGDELIHDLVESDELVVELFDFKGENWPPHAAGVVTQIPTYSEPENITISQSSNTKISPLSFDISYGDNVIETGSISSLTPPQSPPCNDIFSIIPQQPHTTPVQFHTLHYHPVTAAISVQQIPDSDYVIPTTTPTELHPLSIATPQFSNNNANVEVKNELEQAQLVDQIIEELAKDLPDMSDEYESQYTYSPPSQIEETTNDEEWTPPQSANSSPSRYSSSSSSSSSCSGDERHQLDADQLNAIAPVTKKRRPYGRGVEDRKIRKKEQNKNAATRYRQKKKLEMELVLDEEQKLTQRNEELQGQFSKCVREVKYLRSLIREFYRKESQRSA